ncbi:MAG TPA: FlgD immunoglobulin-like domain containing protein [archaeon]|nr:FlgD immunoglobulin-like domain containing protein [archaeon]
MIRTAVISLLMLASALYSWQPASPIKVDIDVTEVAGFNYPMVITVKAGLNLVGLNPDLIDSESEIKIFIPPAIELMEGDLYWKGKLIPGEDIYLSIKIIPTVDYPLTYDIGAIVLNDLLGELPVITCGKSIYLEASKGAVLSDFIYEQVDNNPWLKKSLGYIETFVQDNYGNKSRILGFIANNLQQDDFSGYYSLQETQEIRPNKLYNEEWINYHKMTRLQKEMSPEAQRLYQLKKSIFSKAIISREEVLDYHNQLMEYKNRSLSIKNSVDTDVKKKRKSGTVLSSDWIYVYGGIFNTEGGVEDILCELYLESSPGEWDLVGTDYSGDFAGAYSFIVHDVDVEDTYRVIFRMKNSYGDTVTNDTGPIFTMIDSSSEVNGFTINFGDESFNDVSTTYDHAAYVHQNLFDVRDKTEDDADFSCDIVKCEYPSSDPILDPAKGAYYYGDNKIIVLSTSYDDETVYHEFGHHVYYHAGGELQGGESSYSKYCFIASSDDSVSFREGWAEHYAAWVYNTNLEENECYDPEDEWSGIGAYYMLHNKFGIYDLKDSNDDGEGVPLSMNNIITDLNGAYIWGDFVDNLKSTYPGGASEIDSVSRINNLPMTGSTLLASVGSSPDITGSEESSNLLQNFPNPFNPSSTVSFVIAGNEAQEVKITVYDIRGRLVKKLVRGMREPGKHLVFWDGTDSMGRPVASGTYFYRLVTENFTSTRKMVIIK